MNETVKDEFDALPLDVQVSLARVAELIRSMGLDKVGMPYVRYLQGKIWEMRGRGKDGIARSLYVAVKDRHIVIVRSFVKKTQRTPQDELKIALKRAKEVL